MYIKLAIELIKEVRSWMAEGVNSDMFISEIESIDTVIRELEKPTYTPDDMQSFWIWAYNNGWYYGELTEGWYHCDQMDDTKHTIDEVLKLWEATE